MASNPVLPWGQSRPLKARLSNFLSWWRAELLAALPARWKERLSGAGAFLPVGLLGDTLLAYEAKSGVLAEASRIPLAGLDASGKALALKRLTESRGGIAQNVMLVLGSDQYSSRVIELPKAAEEALREVVSFELDRFTPFKPNQAHFAARVIGRSRDGSKIKVELITAPKSEVELLLSSFAAMGARIGAVVPREASGAGWHELNLLETSFSSTGLSSRAKLNLGLTAACCLLAGAALLLPIWQKRDAAIALLPHLNAAQAESSQVGRKRTELEQLAADANFIHSRKHAQVPVTVLFEDLARALPDTTWIAALEIKTSAKQKELILTGDTVSATKFVDLLEQLPYLKNPAFRSPLMKTPGQTFERFVVAAEIKPRTVPPPERLAGVAAALSPSVGPSATPSSPKVTAPGAGMSPPAKDVALTPAPTTSPTPAAVTPAQAPAAQQTLPPADPAAKAIPPKGSAPAKAAP